MVTFVGPPLQHTHFGFHFAIPTSQHFVAADHGGWQDSSIELFFFFFFFVLQGKRCQIEDSVGFRVNLDDAVLSKMQTTRVKLS